MRYWGGICLKQNDLHMVQLMSLPPRLLLLFKCFIKIQNGLPFWCLLTQIILELECGPMPNVMVALPNIGGALCSTPQSLADAHY